jgi:probable rRNA maturation factor
MITLDILDGILNPDGSPPVDLGILEKAAWQALQEAPGYPEQDLSIVLSDDEQLHSLNLQFLGQDSPTDVLSFPSGELDPDSGRPYLGDVILSYPRALAQATAGGYPVEAELQLLTVHGVLHLLGYDHADAQQQAAMWAVQAKILGELGSPLTFPAG